MITILRPILFFLLAPAFAIAAQAAGTVQDDLPTGKGREEAASVAESERTGDLLSSLAWQSRRIAQPPPFSHQSA